MELEPLIAARAKENQRLSEGAGNKGMQISDNLKIDTKKELAKIAGALRSFRGATYRRG